MVSRRISGTKSWLWQSAACGLFSQFVLMDGELFAQATVPKAPTPLQRAVNGPVLQPVPKIIPVAGPGGSTNSADVNRQLEMLYRQDGRDVPEYLLEGATAAPQQAAPVQPGPAPQQPGNQGSLQYGPAPQRNNTSNWFKPGNPGAQPQPLPQQTTQQARPIQGASAQAGYTPPPQKSNPVTGFFKKIFRGKSAEAPASTAAPIPPDMVSQNLSVPPAPGAEESLPLPLATPLQPPMAIPAPLATTIAPVLQPTAPLVPVLDAYGIPPACPPLPGQTGPYLANSAPPVAAPLPALPVIQGAPAAAAPANVAIQSQPQPLAAPQDAPVFEPPMQRGTAPQQPAGVARVKTPPTPAKAASQPTAAPVATSDQLASQPPRPVAPQSPVPAALPTMETAALPSVPSDGPTISPLKPLDEIEDPFAEPAETPSVAQQEPMKDPAPAGDDFEPFPEMSEDEADEILDINPFSGLTLEEAAEPTDEAVAAQGPVSPEPADPTELATPEPETQAAASKASPLEDLPPLEELPPGPALEAAAPKLAVTDEDDLSLPDLEAPPALTVPDAAPKREDLPAAESKPLSPVPKPQPEKLAMLKPLSPEVEEKMQRIRERDGMTGLKGFCPVTLRDQRELKDAQTQFEAAYRGQKFHFASVDAKSKFLSDPARYAPAAYGADVVSLARDKDVVEGTLDHAAWFRGRLYLFGSQVSHDTFVQNPVEFAVATDE